jgi:hypothetical protein
MIYGLVNMTWTLSTGKPVYPPLDFKSAMTAVWALVLLLLEIGGYALMTYLTKIKLRKITEKDR